jgi:hypothetical protein
MMAAAVGAKACFLKGLFSQTLSRAFQTEKLNAAIRPITTSIQYCPSTPKKLNL